MEKFGSGIDKHPESATLLKIHLFRWSPFVFPSEYVLYLWKGKLEQVTRGMLICRETGVGKVRGCCVRLPPPRHSEQVHTQNWPLAESKSIVLNVSCHPKCTRFLVLPSRERHTWQKLVLSLAFLSNSTLHVVHERKCSKRLIHWNNAFGSHAFYSPCF